MENEDKNSKKNQLGYIIEKLKNDLQGDLNLKQELIDKLMNLFSACTPAGEGAGPGEGAEAGESKGGKRKSSKMRKLNKRKSRRHKKISHYYK